MPIHILPPQLANQIAAGEVVERPASVIKELLENSLDAGATKIEIEIEKGGHKRILVRDNGSGIDKDELPLALSRHATSKIETLADLEHIMSLGFRGEALASISSVARLTLSSKPEAQSQAWQAKSEGRDMQVQLQPAAHPKGSSVDVLDLFFNTPARRKFLRSEKTEFSHIDETLKRIALSRFDVSFSLKHNHKVIRNLPAISDPARYFQRVKKLCGNDFAESALHLNSEYNDYQLTGWIAGPDYLRSQNDSQYFYINGRMIRDKLINHAIRQSFAEYLPDGYYPAFVLYLTLPATQVDVNVHPTKHEVRFHQARLVHDFVAQAVKSVVVENLLQHESEPTAVQPIARHNYIKPILAEAQTNLNEPVTNTAYSTPDNTDTGRASYQTREAHPDYSGQVARIKTPASQMSTTAAANYQSLMRVKEHQASSILATSVAAHAHYFILEEQQVLLQAQHAHYFFSMSRCWLAHLAQLWLQQAPIAQPLLMPVSIKTNQADLQDFESLCAQLQTLAIDLTSNNERIILRKVPAQTRELPWADILPDLLQLSAEQAATTQLVIDCIGAKFIRLNHKQLAIAEQYLQQLCGSDEDDLQHFLDNNAKRVPLRDWLDSLTNQS